MAELFAGRMARADRAPDEKVEMLKEVFLNFNEKYKSPEFIIPTNDKIDKTFLIDALEGKREEMLSTIKTTDLSQLCIDFEVPPFDVMTELNGPSKPYFILKDIFGR